MTSAAQAFVDQARDLPVMPAVAAQVVRQAQDPDTDVNLMSELISRDTGLALRVLKLANSSFYSMPRELETLHQAIVLLGFTTLRSVVVAAALKDVFARFGLAERLLWEHAVAGSIAAATLAQHVGGLVQAEAFIGGLVHDVGKLVLQHEEPERYGEVMRAVFADECDAISAEREIFGFDHAQVGELLLGKWELPEKLARAVGAHHDPTSASEDSAPLAGLLQTADLLCLQLGHGRRRPNPEIAPWDCEGARILGLDESDFAELAEAFKARYAAEREMFA